MRRNEKSGSKSRGRKRRRFAPRRRTKLTLSYELSRTGLLSKRKKRCNRSERLPSRGWPTLKENSIRSLKLRSSLLPAVTNVSARRSRMVSVKGMNSSSKNSKTSRTSNWMGNGETSSG